MTTLVNAVVWLLVLAAGRPLGRTRGEHLLATSSKSLPLSWLPTPVLIALAAVAAAQGVRLQHVKAHGALYNMACVDGEMAAAIARATAAVDRSLVLFGLPGSALLEAGRSLGLRVAAEVFADRAYLANGALVPRSSPRLTS